MRRLLGILLVVALAIAGALLKQQPTHSTPPKTPAEKQAPAAPERPARPEVVKAPAPPRTGPGFVLSLSWSPAFCASRDSEGDSDQCEIGGGSGLVVHGLWPDGRQEFCSTSEPDRLRDDVARDVRRYMPSVGLARHEWQKHGSCSGLSQRDYFAATERAWNNFRQPDLLRSASREQRVERNRLLDAIAKVNPGMPGNAVALQCGKGGTLKEIRVCLDGGLSPRACPTDTRRSCSGTITILPLL